LRFWYLRRRPEIIHAVGNLIENAVDFAVTTVALIEAPAQPLMIVEVGSPPTGAARYPACPGSGVWFGLAVQSASASGSVCAPQETT